MLAEHFHVRLWQEEDLPSLVRLEAGAQPFPWTPRLFTESFSGGHAGWVVVYTAHHGQARPVAFAVVTSVLDESCLLNICVDERLQGQGLGRRLLSHVIDELRRAGQSVLQLEVRCSNQRAIALYEATGFRQDGVRKAYYPAGKGREDALLYSLPLKT